MADQIYNANYLIEGEIRGRAADIERLLNANLLTYIGPIDEHAQGLLKIAVESVATRKRRLVVLLETYGGQIESAERIAHTLRHHHPIVDFVITSYAMSAGTVLVMSGDNIYMDYSATLGPIDPQLWRPARRGYVPALGYLEQYERLIEKSRSPEGLSPAEIAYLLNSFDPAELYQYEQARDLSVALLEQWLVKYKFKNWKVTESKGTKVTIAMKRKRAQEIAEMLNETTRWHSHSRGISMEVARRDLKLVIKDIDDEPELKDKFAAYNELLHDYRMKRSHESYVVDWNGGYFGH